MHLEPQLLQELKRQSVHILAGLFMAAAVWQVKPMMGFYILVPMLIIIFLLWTLPRMAPNLMPIKHVIAHFEREKDIKEFPFKGAFWYNVGITLPVTLLDRDMACAIIIILSLGDGMSTLVGRFVGKHRIGRKSIEGFIAFVVFSALGSSLLLDPIRALQFSLVGGLVEMIEFFDDNLMIPLTLTLAAYLVGA
ncbi:MAG: hypothetical protein V1921_07130 [Candidatus Altiarchaeota archaeon]